MWRGPFRAANRSSKGEASRSLTSLPRLDPVRARELVSRFSGQPVLVAGDVMLDRFIVGRVTRISPEAPVPVVQFQSEHVRLGGAANVANNIAALGGRAALLESGARAFRRATPSAHRSQNRASRLLRRRDPHHAEPSRG